MLGVRAGPGTNEMGKPVQFFTASLTGERDNMSGLGNFLYTGETVAGALSTDQQAEHVNAALGEGGSLTSGRMRHGYGEITYDSGSTYMGHWELDKRVGTGKHTFACGDTYEGEWKAGQYNGHGKYTSAESDEYEGQWRDDKMAGHGFYHYRASGDTFEGEWVDGLSHGFGRYTKAITGEVFMGEYDKGELKSLI